MANRKSLVDAAATVVGNRTLATEVVIAIEDAIGRSLAIGEPVRLASLGSLVPERVAPRSVRNPLTGEPMITAPTTRVRMRASSNLKRDMSRHMPERKDAQPE
ncbi:hypothetical protein GCM10025867_47190 (plasmid) [Frondihabitans sucicola]|uniref:HU family DNA-binding protein n=1 Tax=Frondihabitans sucicola TaxID=1268041 RepID=A0ABM8GVI1_9MICO|nr:HU family DNA-binding protein [Frondihabitans sucicola]BDZ52478.1 hypothetical protein GCM10025867_47190 [Frondihabitans sucicola]